MALVLVLTLGCTDEERPSYKLIDNNLPRGGPVIVYSNDEMTSSLDDIRKFVGEDKYEGFDKSLSWYATESSFSMAKISGKNAHQLVDVVNCLKTESPEGQPGCF